MFVQHSGLWSILCSYVLCVVPGPVHAGKKVSQCMLENELKTLCLHYVHPARSRCLVTLLVHGYSAATCADALNETTQLRLCSAKTMKMPC